MWSLFDPKIVRFSTHNQTYWGVSHPKLNKSLAIMFFSQNLQNYPHDYVNSKDVSDLRPIYADN